MSLARLGTREVARLSPAATVLDAVRMMVARDVGSIVAVDEDGAPCGILTDRDVLVRILAPGRDAGRVLLADAMSRDPVTVRDTDPPDEAAWRMREHRVRRLPVVDADGRLCAIVALDDLLGKVASLRGDVAELLASFHATNQAV